MKRRFNWCIIRSESHFAPCLKGFPSHTNLQSDVISLCSKTCFCGPPLPSEWAHQLSPSVERVTSSAPAGASRHNLVFEASVGSGGRLGPVYL